MSSAAIISLTYPPTANRLWRYVNGRAIKSAEYREWLRVSAIGIAVQGERPVPGPYAMTIAVMRPDRRKRDISNLVKAVEDAIVAAGMVDDDSLCQRLTAEWVGKQDGAVRVSIIATAPVGLLA